MFQVSIDKTSKMPIYAQIKDQIKYYISTGAITVEERMPPIRALAKELGINFQTVRKAYIELEHEGLISVKHGTGTFISLNSSMPGRFEREKHARHNGSEDIRVNLESDIESALEKYEKLGLGLAESRDIINTVCERIEQRRSSPAVVFAECNHFQITEISRLLEEELGIPVVPMMVNQLSAKLPQYVKEGRVVNVVTTGFHVNEVRSSIGDLPVEIDVLITNLNPNTRRQIEAVGEKGRFSFICRDRESAVLYKDLLKAELGFEQLDLTCCTIYESAKVQDALNSSDIVLASPPVYDEVRRIAPKRKVVYNVFERVDPMSLRVIRDRILGVGK